MDKVLVEIYIPIIEKSFDAFIPKELSVAQVISLLNEILFSLQIDYEITKQDTVLCERETGIIYDLNKAVYETRIKNGSRLMLL